MNFESLHSFYEFEDDAARIFGYFCEGWLKKANPKNVEVDYEIV